MQIHEIFKEAVVKGVKTLPATTTPAPGAVTPTPSNASGYAKVSQPGTVNYSGMAGSTATPTANQPQRPNQTQGAATPAKPESTWQWLKREFKNVPKDIYTGGTAKGEVDAWKNAYKSGALSKALVGRAVAGLGNAIRRNAPYGHYDNSDSGESVRVKDAKGVEHVYNKVGNKWYSKDNKEVDTATAAMLDDRAEQQATAKSSTTTAPAADTTAPTDTTTTTTAPSTNTVAPTPLQVGPGVQPQMTTTPSKVSFNTTPPTTQTAKTRTGGRAAGAPLSQTPNAVRKRASRLANKAVPAGAGANAFGQMAQQLTPQQTSSSTGGTIKQTPTGLVHTAKPAATTTVATPAKKRTTTKKTATSAPTWKGRGKNLTKQQQDYISAINARQPQSVAENKFSKLETMLAQALHAHGYTK